MRPGVSRSPSPRSSGTTRRSAPCAGPSLPRGRSGISVLRSFGGKSHSTGSAKHARASWEHPGLETWNTLTADVFRHCVHVFASRSRCPLPIVGSVRPGRCRYRVRPRPRPPGTARGPAGILDEGAAVRVVQSSSSRPFDAMHGASDGADAIEAMPGRRRSRYERGGVTENTSPTGRPDREQPRLSASRRHHARDGCPFRTRASCCAGGKLLSTSGR